MTLLMTDCLNGCRKVRTLCQMAVETSIGSPLPPAFSPTKSDRYGRMLFPARSML